MLDMIKDRLGVIHLALLPYGVESGFKGVIDILKMKAVYGLMMELGAKFQEKKSQMI